MTKITDTLYLNVNLAYKLAKDQMGWRLCFRKPEGGEMQYDIPEEAAQRVLDAFSKFA